MRWKATDALTPLLSAEYSLDGGPWTYAQPSTRLTDSLEHDYDISIAKPEGSEITIAVRVTDENDNVATAKTVLR